MTRNLKVLGLALAALCALCAVGASTASAEPSQQFTSESSTTTIRITQDSKLESEQTGWQVFQIGAAAGKKQPITCKGFHLHIHITGQAQKNAIVGKPTYTNCQFNGVNVSVNAHACEYEASPAGSIKVVNCGTQFIEFESGECNVKVGNQVALPITFHNVQLANTKMGITIEVKVQSGTLIQYTATGLECLEQGQKTAGQYVGNALAEGEEPTAKTATGITVS